MEPVTFGPADAAVMRIVAPLIRGWCSLTGRRAQDLARLALFVALVFDVVKSVKGDGWDLAIGVVAVPIILTGISLMIRDWDAAGDVLPRPGWWLRARVVWAVFLVTDLRFFVGQRATIPHVSDLGADIGFVICVFAMTWVGRPPVSIFSRFRSSLHFPTLARIAP